MKQQIADFSRQLDLDELYAYITDVKRSTETIVNNLPYDRLGWKVSEERKERLKSLQVVSTDEKASWLIDYWCGKDNSRVDPNAVFTSLDHAYRGMLEDKVQVIFINNITNIIVYG